jgi:uncharacterized Zn-finger protein
MDTTYTTTIGMPGAAKSQTCQQFRNDSGVKEIRIGVKDLECIGATPPQDHPHVYLEMGNLDTIPCPYCGTIFCYDRGLGPFEAVPAESLYNGLAAT